ncbi:MAG: hypothetical protein LCH32_05545 [Bacteroidetes bacterium]|nr:hypothetical protein [Bacteroidota bacterium]
MFSKIQLITECKTVLNIKINQLKSDLNLINDAIQNETKSTVGDKHEVAKAHYQTEQQKLQTQLINAEFQLNQLLKINLQHTKQITLGSLFKTNNQWFYMSVSIGKVYVENNCVITLSSDSPFSKAFSGKKENETVFFNNINYTIEKII